MQCVLCDKEFEARRGEHHRQFCSTRCEKVSKRYLWCGRPQEIPAGIMQKLLKAGFKPPKERSRRFYE